MSFEGMDPDAVIRIAQKLKTQQQQVVRVATTVDGTVRGSQSVWKGSDVAQFTSQWGTHRAQLIAVGEALAELASKAYQNALQQIQTSDDYAGGAAVGAAAGGSGGGSDGGLLKKAWDLWNKDLWKTDHSVSGTWGPHFDKSGSTTIGGIPVSGDVSGGAGAHGTAGYHGSFSLRHGLDVGADASGQAGLYGQANGHIGNQYANGNGSVGALLGVQGDAGASGHLGLNGASGKLEAGGFAGGQITASEDGDVLGVHENAGASAQFGIGAGGSLDGSVSTHDIGGDFDFHVAFGPGFDIKGGVHVDPGEVLDDAGSLVNKGLGSIGIHL